MSFVVFLNGIAMAAMAAMMGLVAIAFPATAPVFGESALIAGFVGGLVALASRRPVHALRPAHAFLLTATIWLTVAICGTLPLALWQLPVTDAFFEAMSGITTTGSTVMVGLDTTPRGILFWRALLQALGGIGFVVTGVALLPILKVGGMQLFRTESSEKGEKEFADAARFALVTLIVYGSLMLLCFLAYLVGGMGVFDAITHAMTTLSTGGYSNYDASFGHFEQPFLHYVATAFMALGAVPFAWYIRAVLKGRWHSEQVRMFASFVGGAILLLTLWRVLATGAGIEVAFRDVAFNVVSVVTTTGYATADYTTWGAFATAAFLALTAVGGCTGSTSGGAKMMRWVVFFRLTGREIRQLHAPHAVLVARYEGRPITDDVAAGVITFFTLYFGTVLALGMGLSLTGLDLLTSLSGALTAVANVGPGVGTIIGPAGNFATLDDGAKLLLTIGMYLGRLELLTVLVLFLPVYWQAFES